MSNIDDEWLRQERLLDTQGLARVFPSYNTLAEAKKAYINGEITLDTFERQARYFVSVEEE